VLNAGEALAVAATWIAQSHTACDDAGGKFLAVNGETCKAGVRTIWSQRVEVVAGADYRFCANVRHLPQHAFDVVPRVELRFNGVASSTPLVLPVLQREPCDWMLLSADLHIPSDVGSLVCEIRLLDESAGDGNDLALDDISLQRVGISSVGNPPQ